ncbi:MAG: type VI secretion system tip protein VgrG, partial [Gammaproteobacteria bacterium]|nr:type VI secretion system tip protein VgrG [Gammaproteobacteria bacterium]
MPLEYGNRSLFIDSPELELTSIGGQETISALFQFELELVSGNLNLDANDYIGEQISFGVKERELSTEKVYSGFIQQLVAGPVLGSGNRYYKMTIVPNLWLLTQSSACRVYQEKSVKDIIADVLKQCAVKIDVKYSLTGVYAKREYCVQYQETDFNFISRLMEEEGIFYYFEYSSDMHTLVIGDSPQSYVVFENNKLSHFNEEAIAEQICDWTEHTAFHTGQWEVESYDFTKVNVLNGTVKGNKLKNSIYNKITKYDYVSKVKDKSNIDHLAKMRMEADEASHKYINASSNYLSPVCAGVFELSDHGVKDLVGSSYVITSIRYYISEGENYIGGS